MENETLRKYRTLNMRSTTCPRAGRRVRIYRGRVSSRVQMSVVKHKAVVALSKRLLGPTWRSSVMKERRFVGESGVWRRSPRSRGPKEWFFPLRVSLL